MHTLRKIASAIIALTLLTVAADVSIFHRTDIAKYLEAAGAIIPPRPPRFLEFAIALLSGLALLGLLIILRRLASGVAASVRYLWDPRQSYEGLEPKERITLENDLRANRIQVITTVVQALGGIAVVIGIYFAWANLKTTQEAQKDTQKSQAETIRLTNEGQITDRFTKAIDQLGSPQLELRLGGIYALERIARDSEKDHWPIVEVLTTFVRVHAPIAKTSDQPSKPHGKNPPFSHKAYSPSAVPVAVPSPDVQAILTVIGRRDPSFEKGENEKLNLSDTNLTGANMNDANLNDAHLFRATLSGASLNDAHLLGTNMFGADLTGAHLFGAHLNGANLSSAHLDGARLDGAHLNDADLFGTYLVAASLRGADLRGADLAIANLNGALLLGAQLMGVDLSGANLKSSIGLTQSQVDSALGDKDTALPPEIVMPESWKHSTATATTAGAPKSP